MAYARRGARESRTAAGLADTATGERARPDHRFRIAGSTQSFVATVLLQLEGEGRLSLDDSVETWLPGVVRGGANLRKEPPVPYTEALGRAQAAVLMRLRRRQAGVRLLRPGEGAEEP